MIEAKDVPHAISRLSARGYIIQTLNGAPVAHVAVNSAPATRATVPAAIPAPVAQAMPQVQAHTPVRQVIATPTPAKAKDYSELKARLNRKRFLDRQTTFLFSQLASFFTSGMSPATAFSSLAQRAPQSAHGEAYREIAGMVSEGKSLADAMDEFPEIFSPVHAGAVRAGEKAGYLPEACKVVADSTSAAHKLRLFCNFAFAYFFLAMLTIPFSFAVSAALKASIEDSWNSSNPTPLSGLQALGGGLGTALAGPVGWFMFAVILCWIIAIQYLWRWKRREFRHRFAATAPILSSRTKSECFGLFGYHLGKLFEAGLAPQQAFALAAGAIPNEHMAEALAAEGRAMRENTKLSEVMARSQVFPSEFAQMAMTGEMTGQMQDMMKHVTEMATAGIGAFDRQFRAKLYIVATIVLALTIGMAVFIFFQNYVTTLLRVTSNID